MNLVSKFWPLLLVFILGSVISVGLYGFPWETSCVDANKNTTLFQPLYYQNALRANLGLESNIPNYKVNLIFQPSSASCKKLDSGEARIIVSNNSPLLQPLMKASGFIACTPKNISTDFEAFCLKPDMQASFVFPGDKPLSFAYIGNAWFSDCPSILSTEKTVDTSMKMCSSPEIANYIWAVLWVFIASLVIVSSFVTLIEYRKH